MKVSKMTILALAACALFGGQAAQAQSDEVRGAAAGAALAALGLIAFKHHKHNHEEAEHRADEAYEANYERGYNDALYAAHYDTSVRGEGYNDGYEAGQYEREHRVNHNRQDAYYDDRHSAPERIMQACVTEAVDSFDIPSYDVHPVRSEMDGDRYLVEVAAGYRHAVCDVERSGRIRGMRDGRL